MKSLNLFLNRIANWKTLLFFLAIYFLFAAYFLKNAEERINELAGKKIGVIDLTFGFNPQKTLNMIAEYGNAARAYYAQTEMTTDLLYPLVYAFLFGIILTLLFRNKPYQPFALLNTLPFLCLIFDYAENINIVILLRTFPEQSPTIAVLCEFFKLIKWLTLGVIIMATIYGLIRLLLDKTKTS